MQLQIYIIFDKRYTKYIFVKIRSFRWRYIARVWVDLTVNIIEMLNCYSCGLKEVLSFHLRKNPSRISTSKINWIQINKILALSLQEGVQSSDWLAQLSITIKRVWNLNFFIFCYLLILFYYLVSFHNDIIF